MWVQLWTFYQKIYLKLMFEDDSDVGDIEMLVSDVNIFSMLVPDANGSLQK